MELKIELPINLRLLDLKQLNQQNLKSQVKICNLVVLSSRENFGEEELLALNGGEENPRIFSIHCISRGGILYQLDKIEFTKRVLANEVLTKIFI